MSNQVEAATGFGHSYWSSSDLLPGKYYADNVVLSPLDNIAGGISDGNILMLTQPADGLVPGIVVTGAGVPVGTVILSISADHTILHLSETVADSPPQLGYTRTVSITVNDVAPAVTLYRSAAIAQGATFSDVGAFASVTPGSCAATVDYGDGTGPQPLPLGASGTFVLSHAYTRPGTFVVKVTVADAFGGVSADELTVRATAAPLVSGHGQARDELVTALYLNDLGRLPDPRSLRAWARRLEAGMNPKAVARRIWNSRERRRLSSEGLVAPNTFRRSYLDAIRERRRDLRLHLPPPTGLVTVSIAGASPAQAPPTDGNGTP